MLDKELSDFLLLHGCKAAIRAGKEIMKHYSREDMNIMLKSDSSVITEADTYSHNTIKDILTATRIPLLSEEGRSMLYEERYNWDLYWLVDPLDGTHEFIQHNGEFIVSIALMSENVPTLGIIYVPASDKLYFSSDYRGVFKMDKPLEGYMDADNVDIFISNSKKITSERNSNDKVKVIVTRSHYTDETESKLNEIRKTYGDIEVIKCGSGLKFCMLADGDADIYIRTTDLFDWDIAAGDAIMRGLGYTMLHNNGKQIKYNKSELKITPFYVSCI